MPEHGKGGLFFNAPDGHSNRRRIKMTYKEFEMQVKTYLEENLGADVTVSTYTAILADRSGSRLAPPF